MPSPPVLAARLSWEGVGDGLATANPAEEPRKGWLGRRGIFFPPFLLPFCSSVMEAIQGLLQQDLKLQGLYSIKKVIFTCANL